VSFGETYLEIKQIGEHFLGARKWSRSREFIIVTVGVVRADP
jgi:hypothetical protein